MVVYYYTCRYWTILVIEGFMIKVGIIGVTGYVGIELLRLLQLHPLVSITNVFTDTYSGEEIAAIYPHLRGLTAIRGEKLQLDVIHKHCDVVFVSLPHGHAMRMAQSILDAGIKIIDLGADFRLKNPSHYEHWYKHQAATATLLNQAVYGLPENDNKTLIARASLIANPGCYPTAALLATIPAIKSGIIELDEYIFDAKSGVSGAGRTLSLNSHFCEISENMMAYQIAGQHRHTPEIEQELGLLTEQPAVIQFTPHVVPIVRGLLVTAYFKLTDLLSAKEVHAIYQQHYKHETFIRISPLNNIPQIKQVRGTNYCDIGLHVDPRTKRLIVVSVIDNLIKGAAGQAIQNMNLMYQFDETTGLNPIFATYP